MHRQREEAIFVLVFLLALIFTLPGNSHGQSLFDDLYSDCPLKGRRLTPIELEPILLAHSRWLRAPATGQRANLCGTNLSDVRLAIDLRKADLRKINLSGADLHPDRFEYAPDTHQGDFAEANLVGADLRRTNLFMVNLTQANLSGADLSGAELLAASLRQAILRGTKLHGARLIGVNLSGADLSDADLGEAILTRSRVSGVIFEPQSLPDPLKFMDAEGLPEMTYSHSRHALAGLSEAFQKAGLREQQRQITYAVRHSDRLRAWKSDNVSDNVDSLFNLVLLEWPCAYGLYPGRALRILGLLILIFSVPYMFALTTGKGIYAVWPEKRIRDDDPDAVAGKPVPASPNLFFPNLRIRFPREAVRPVAVVVAGLYFSFLSTFHIGWRELSVGTWLARVQPRDYTLVASGWVKTISGLQSIMSVYLLALWVLTYFGRPFE